MASERTQKLLDQVDKAHDWRLGQVYSGGGTKLSSTDECRICGLQRHFFSDSQNGVGREFSFCASDGTKLSLAEAARISCE